VLLLGNHISWIDWAIVQIACPRPVRFVMIRNIYERWYLRWFFELFGTVPISGGASSKTALKKVAELLNRGEVVCLFPEGSISRTGHLVEFRKGYERACSEANDDVVILPFYLRGLWGSRFSRSENKISNEVRSGFSRDIIVAFGEPLSKDTTADVLKRRIFDLSESSWQHYAEGLPTIGEAWIDTVKAQGSAMAIADTLGEPLSATRALTAAIVFAKRIRKLSPAQNVGLLLPSSIGATVANMAVMLNGQTLVNLNYTASESALLNALSQADLPCIFTSRRFLQKLKGRGVEFEQLLSAVPVYYLEDIKAEIGKATMLSTLLMVKFLPRSWLKRVFCRACDPQATAAILFSSGSEGAPKGIMLSHRNIMANIKQCADVLNLREDDVVMSSLPQFHAFGLTVTQFMPLIEGVPMVCHADPTDALGCAKAIAKYRATFMCGTSTFLRLYVNNRRVHPLMLASLRIVVAGAEKLNPDVRKRFKLKFNKDIFEGYGATETTPVASVNLPDQLDTNYWQVQLGAKEGTVGMPLPGSSFKVVDPDTLEELPTGEDGLIMLGGSQVMLGYLNNP
jgi:acyl-[acyl-carrier-protein]-phospholipid O-acyltransferase/long-chain-fatty-acid--[acyl-carrier-protein] ligase